MTNKQIASYFSLLAKLMDVHGENEFRAKSYANTAFQIERAEVELATLPENELAAQRGIGISTAKKIIEIITTQQLKPLTILQQKTPNGILELLSIKGIGPKKIATLWHEMNIESPGELLYACTENRLTAYKGFGEKTQSNIHEAVSYFLNNKGSFLYAEIEKTTHELDQFLKSTFNTNVYLTGSFIRHCEIIEQLEWVIQKPIQEIKNILSDNENFVLQNETSNNIIYLFVGNIKIVLHSTNSENYHQLAFTTTNSIAFNTLFQQSFPTVSFNLPEHEIFKTAGITYIAPPLRDNELILSLAKENKIPQLIQPQDIKGVIHTHSTWSDGTHTIQAMAKKCIELGYEYLVISDHSKTSFYANGLTEERIKAQHEEINKLNEQLAPFKIFKSIECDILNNGELDYGADVLESFDLVIASIHQNLKMTEEKAMQRLITAVQNPYTTILGHPSGRLLLSRKAYPVDYELLISECAKHNVAIEINANPRRLDLDWQWIQTAVSNNIMLSINPDAHSVQGIADIRHGVLAAQKGLLTSLQNVSSFSLEGFKNFMKK